MHDDGLGRWVRWRTVKYVKRMSNDCGGLGAVGVWFIGLSLHEKNDARLPDSVPRGNWMNETHFPRRYLHRSYHIERYRMPQ